MNGEAAKCFYDDFLSELKKQYEQDKIKDGVFGAMMQVRGCSKMPSCKIALVVSIDLFLSRFVRFHTMEYIGSIQCFLFMMSLLLKNCTRENESQFPWAGL